MNKKKKIEKNLTKIKFMKFIRTNLSLISFLGIIILIGIAILFSHLKDNYINANSKIVYGDDVIEMHFFHLVTCPHCIEQKKFHKILVEKYPNLKIIEYDMADKSSREKYLELAKSHGFKEPENNIATPTTFIGNKSNIGFGSSETTGVILINLIEEENLRIMNNWNNQTMKTTIELRNEAQGIK